MWIRRFREGGSGIHKGVFKVVDNVPEHLGVNLIVVLNTTITRSKQSLIKMDLQTKSSITPCSLSNKIDFLDLGWLPITPNT